MWGWLPSSWRIRRSWRKRSSRLPSAAPGRRSAVVVSDTLTQRDLELFEGGLRTIAIFDEAFRGINVADALEASKAVLVGCSRARRSTFIFSSHLVELADELSELDSVEFRYFDGELDGDDLRFDYRLRPGVSRKRFGMELLRREGLPELLAAISPSDAA